MIHIKTKDEVKAMRESGKLLAEVLQEVIAAVKPGVTLPELDSVAKEAVLKRGAESSILEYTGKGGMPPFPSYICASVNNEIVHAPAARDVTLYEGDVIGIDIGLVYKGWHADMAETVPVGEISKEAKKLLSVTKEAMYKGIEVAKVGNTLNDIGQTVYDFVEENNFGTVTTFCGHGIGREIHEEPPVPNYPTKQGEEVVLKEGMVIAIEPMVTAGGPGLEIDDADGWTAKTQDGGLGAHFERTVAITADGPQILTKLQ